MNFGSLYSGNDALMTSDFDETFSLSIPSDYQGCYVKIYGTSRCCSSFYGECGGGEEVFVSIPSAGCSQADNCIVDITPGGTITGITFISEDGDHSIDCSSWSYYDSSSVSYHISKYSYCGDDTCRQKSGTIGTCVDGELVEEDCNNCPEDCLDSGNVCCLSSSGSWSKISPSGDYDLDCCDDSDCSSGYECQSYRCAAEPTCGNGVCSLIAEAENCQVCPADCPTPSGDCCVPSSSNAVSSGYVFEGTQIDSTHVCCSGTSYTGDCCDDDNCNWDETCVSRWCTSAGSECGDGTCDSDEDCSSCPSDCTGYSSQCCYPSSSNANSKGYVSSGYATTSTSICCSGTTYSGNCCDRYACTSTQICQSHYCTTESGGDLGLCESCSSNSECASGYCSTFSSGLQKCTTGVSGTCCGTNWIIGFTEGDDCCSSDDCYGTDRCYDYKCSTLGSGGDTGDTSLCYTCSSDNDCASGHCASFGDGTNKCTTGVSGTCCTDKKWIAGYDRGVDCCSDSSCSGDDVCVNYKCVEPPELEANGAICTSNSQCTSGNCRAVCCKAGETCCRYEIDCTESKECNSENFCVHTEDQCSPGCRERELGDDSCDVLCDTVACNFDEGDCERRGRCNNDDNCDWSEGEDCETCPNDCGCPYYQCCAPDTSYAEPDNWGCIWNDDRIDTRTICCDGAVEDAGFGQKCEDVYESRKKPYGGSCSSNDNCKEGLCDPGLGICCGGSYTESENCCRDHDDCSSGRFCNDYHRCELKRGEGAYCNLNVECQSNGCWSSKCTVEPEIMTYGETCESSWDCEEGLACKKGKDTSRMFCCPEGNQWCCGQDSDCAEAVIDDYYCYKGSDIDSSKWFSCQATTKTIRKREYQAKRLSGEEKGILGEACNGNDDDCWSGHCANGYCCSWGSCCATNSDCGEGGCIPEYHRCVQEDPEDYAKRMQESVENTIEDRVESKHIEETKEYILGLEAEFYISTPSKEGEGIIGKKLTAIMVIGNKGDENIYVKARIDDDASTHIENERYDISHWDPEKDKTWLDSVPVISWVINALKKINTWLWEAVQELWSKDDEGFYEIWPRTVFSITYEFEPTSEGWYDFYGDIKYYSKVGGEELFSHNSNTDTYEMREIKDIITVKFEKRIWVREPECGALGFVCN